MSLNAKEIRMKGQWSKANTRFLTALAVTNNSIAVISGQWDGIYMWYQILFNSISVTSGYGHGIYEMLCAMKFHVRSNRILPGDPVVFFITVIVCQGKSWTLASSHLLGKTWPLGRYPCLVLCHLYCFPFPLVYTPGSGNWLWGVPDHSHLLFNRPYTRAQLFKASLA